MRLDAPHGITRVGEASNRATSAGALGGTRVLVISQPTTAGVAVHLRSLVYGAVRAGCQVTVLAPSVGDLPSWAEAAGARYEEMPLSRSPEPADLRHALWLRRYLSGVDLVHVHSSKAGAVGRVAVATTRRSRRPACVFTPHGWSWLVGGRLSGFYRIVEVLLSSVADVTIAVSPGEAHEGAAVLGRRARRICVVENGVDTEHFNPNGHCVSGSGCPYLVCVGRLCRQKGQSTAIQALALARSGDARLGLVGDGEDRIPLLKLAGELGVIDRIDWFGNVADTAPYYRGADIVLVPSRWEGQSLALLEAMACGAPIVASNIPGNEVVAGVGLIVPVDNPAALAESVASLMGSESRRRRCGHLARQRACESHDVQQSVAETLLIWRNVLERARA